MRFVVNRREIASRVGCAMPVFVRLVMGQMLTSVSIALKRNVRFVESSWRREHATHVVSLSVRTTE